MIKKNYPVVDIIKFVFAIMIVLLHANLLNTSTLIEYRIQLTIFGLIVPYFFVSSGFFIGKKVLYTDNDLKSKSGIIIGAGKRFLKLYLIFGSWYFLINLAKCIFLEHGHIEDILKLFHVLLVDSPGGGIWFIYTILWDILLLLILTLFKSKKPLIVAFCMLMVLNILGSVFFLNIFDTLAVRRVYDAVLISDRNVFFFGVFFLGGYLIGTNNRLQSSIKHIFPNLFFIIVFICFGLLCFNRKDVVETLIFAVLKFLAVFSLFELSLIQLPKKINTLLLRKYSTSIYFTHFTFVYVITFFSARFPVNRMICTLICLFLTFLFSSFIIFLKNGKLYNMLFG